MLHIYAAVAEQERTKISERTKAVLAAAKARGVKLGNPHGPIPFTAELRQQGVEAIRRQANARAQQLGEILSARARTPPRRRSTSAACRPRLAASGPRDRSSTSALGSQPGTSNPADVYFGRAETILNGWANVRLRDRAHVEHRIARVVEIDRGDIDEIL